MKITPNFIPHDQFHKGSWLLPIDRPNWYYFKKQKNGNTISNNDFTTSVDGPLRELVKYLHKRGIKTTPSCSGHHIHEKNFEKIYSSLKEDKRDIRNEGLVLKDCETGKIYIYMNKNYLLPWSKKIFLKIVMLYQKEGVIGIKLRNKKLLVIIFIMGFVCVEKTKILKMETMKNGKKRKRRKNIKTKMKKMKNTNMKIKENIKKHIKNEKHKKT